jgi:hypothetical protein
MAQCQLNYALSVLGGERMRYNVRSIKMFRCQAGKDFIKIVGADTLLHSLSCDRDDLVHGRLADRVPALII